MRDNEKINILTFYSCYCYLNYAAKAVKLRTYRKVSDMPVIVYRIFCCNEYAKNTKSLSISRLSAISIDGIVLNRLFLLAGEVRFHPSFF